MCFQKQLAPLKTMTMSSHTGIHMLAWETALEGKMNTVKFLILHLTTSPHTGIHTFAWETRLGLRGYNEHCKVHSHIMSSLVQTIY